MADLQAKRIMDELNDLVSDTCIEIAINLNRQLEEDTPKKTGLASKNWIASKAGRQLVQRSYPDLRRRRRHKRRVLIASDEPSMRSATSKSSSKTTCPTYRV